MILAKLVKLLAHNDGWEYTYGFRENGLITYITIFTDRFVTPQEVLFLDEVSGFIKTDTCAAAYITNSTHQLKLK